MTATSRGSRARSDRDAHVGAGEGRRVVDPIAGHRDGPTAGAFLVDDARLVLGTNLREHEPEAGITAGLCNERRSAAS